MPFPNRAVAAGLSFLLVALLLAYPLVLEVVLAAAGVRAVSAGLLVLALASLALPDPPPFLGVRLPHWPGVGILLLVGAALLLGSRSPLLCVPALIYGALASVLWQSVRGEDSLFWRAVHRMLPDAPDFIAPYCAKLTRVWAAAFAVSALAIAALALAGPLAWWRALTGWVLYALMAVGALVEFFVRKTWFRYYFRGGPFDRFWSRLFPAERTPQGRRSQEAIRRYRESLGSGSDAPLGRTEPGSGTRRQRSATERPSPGCTTSGAMSQRGPSTKARSAMRGCGSSRSGSQSWTSS